MFYGSHEKMTDKTCMTELVEMVAHQNSPLREIHISMRIKLVLSL